MSESKQIYPDLDTVPTGRHRWRMIKDAVARHLVLVGGISVIIAILLIFFYLFYVVFPLLLPASAEKVASYVTPGAERGKTLLMDLEEQAQMGVRYTDQGSALFFAPEDGKVVTETALLEGLKGVSVSSIASGNETGWVGIGLSNGRALVARHQFIISYPDDVRTLSAGMERPFGDAPLLIDDKKQPLIHLALSSSEDQLLVAAVTADQRVLVVSYTKESNLLTDEVTLERQAAVLTEPDVPTDFLLVDPSQRHLYIAGRSGQLLDFDLADPAHPKLLERVTLLEPGRELNALRFLGGGFSLMAGDSTGQISQWFPVRDDRNQTRLQFIRSFESQDAAIAAISSEPRRKGFLAADNSGRVGVYHSTAERTLLVDQVSDISLQHLVVSPRADHFVAEDSTGNLHYWAVHNEHPEVSWKALWGKVHYEGYSEPDYVWQSSSANSDFEPKFSLTPLAFGTFKAAFYAMIIAVPLAIMGAIFTAYFMAPRMRRIVKPTIEVMEALPTVILGFLAGLWLAPLAEAHLPGFFSMLLFMPVGVLLFAYLWQRVPVALRQRIPDGWEAALLLPVIIGIAWLSLSLSSPMEHWLFAGDMRQWLSDEMGMGFDQRNSLVVGIAMGVAVIPPIFSIAEDAIFSVPRHLTNGSLALGATPWQTLVRVVLLTASPGIFSAIMIGLGRAVGETMIVLMSTGNTPVMDFSIFQGMRTLSANIAVEMPESEVGSSHYRILFLAALVLFMFTFVFNTMAEIVRQRLRRKYSSL